MLCRLFAAVIVLMGLLSPATGQSAPDISGKVVLANLDRYDAYLRVGKTKREIKPKKASVLSPKTYPVTIEFWSGNTKVGWRKQTISKAGIYGFNFQQGSWSLAELKRGTTQRPTTRPSSKTVRRRIVSQPVRRLPINADRNRWSPLARAAYAAGNIYQFVRDEQDRDRRESAEVKTTAAHKRTVVARSTGLAKCFTLGCFGLGHGERLRIEPGRLIRVARASQKPVGRPFDF